MSSSKERRSAERRGRKPAYANSPIGSTGKRTDNNAGNVFTVFLFCIVLAIVLAIGWAITRHIDIWVISIAFVVAVVAACAIRVAAEWERAVILRLGKFNRVAGPGIFFIVPFVEHVSLRADLRIMLTSFSAEETLTSDLVPVNVDAVLFWTVWDAQKACTEVEDYQEAVSLTAQTALREALGRRELSDITIHRDQLDQELSVSIEEKTSLWGVSVISVEIRDIVIPKELQESMAAAATAARQKDARIVLAEVEKDVASMLVEATKIYHEDEMAFELRSMHLLSEGVNHGKSSVVIPSAYSEGFKPEK